MPRHKVFIKSIGFQRFNSNKGWKHLRDHLSNREVKIKYLYPKLDQYELLDLLLELPDDQFNNLKERSYNILGYYGMQKSLEKIIEEKIKLISYIVDILDDAAYAERFISKAS